MEYIKKFSVYSEEYRKLEAAANIMNVFAKKSFFVGTCYFDAGQDWVWTTILYKSDYGDVQALTPREQEEILSSTTPYQLGYAVGNYLKKREEK